MILHSLKLQNVGVYAGEQSVTFSRDPDRPITLIGGLNGAGKTTLIRSLFHALYGARALSVVGRRSAYGGFLDSAVHHGAGRAVLELDLEIPAVRADCRIVVRRTWDRPSRGKDQLDVYVDGDYDEELSESWAEAIEQAAPLGIARLFFFDGEKIEALADLEEAAATLRTALGSLLGLDLVEQLSVDLTAVKRRVVREAKGGPSTEELERREARLEAQRQVETSARSRLADLTNRCAEAVTDHGKLLHALRAAGGDLIADRERLDAERAGASAAESLLWDQLRALTARPDTPLLLVGRLLNDMRTTVGQASARAHADAIDTTLRERDAWIVELLREAGIHAPDVHSALDDDRTRRASAAGSPPPYPPAAGADAIQRLIEEELPARCGEALRYLDELDQASATVDELDRRIAKIPSDDSVRILLDARADSEELMTDLEAQRREAEQVLTVSEAQTKRAEDLRDSELERLASAQDQADRGRRITLHAERARITLEEFRRAVSERHVQRIATYATDSLRALLHKEGLVGELSIDPTTFELRLSTRKGDALEPESLSAGERQLTALALLWGLARSAGRPLPVVIDTPLGRLDTGHRRHVVERYLPSASHQVVVLSTDTEIDAAMHDRLEPRVGRAYRLEHEASGATTIASGYFELVSA